MSFLRLCLRVHVRMCGFSVCACGVCVCMHGFVYARFVLCVHVPFVFFVYDRECVSKCVHVPGTLAKVCNFFCVVCECVHCLWTFLACVLCTCLCLYARLRLCLACVAPLFFLFFFRVLAVPKYALARSRTVKSNSAATGALLCPGAFRGLSSLLFLSARFASLCAEQRVW